jgi:tripartite-type tricarboxylate transporter receptor subunit TctC
MQRREVMGACGAFLTTIKATLPEWISGRKFAVPIVIAQQRLKDYPDTPAIAEFIKDAHTRQVFELTFATTEMDRPVLAPPGVPQQRVEELRAAFVATMQDPAFRQEAERSRLSIEYMRGEQLTDTIKRSYAMPADAIETARKAMAARP